MTEKATVALSYGEAIGRKMKWHEMLPPLSVRLKKRVWWGAVGRWFAEQACSDIRARYLEQPASPQSAPQSADNG